MPFVTNTTDAIAVLTWSLISHFLTGKMSSVGFTTAAVAGLVAITLVSGLVGIIDELAIGIAS